MIWETWKKAFYKWEDATADYLETVLKSPLVLKPSGKMLSGVMKLKAKLEETANDSWGRIGLPTKHDQERTLHKLNRMESRINDLEEQLWDLEEQTRPQDAHASDGDEDNEHEEE